MLLLDCNKRFESAIWQKLYVYGEIIETSYLAYANI